MWPLVLTGVMFFRMNTTEPEIQSHEGPRRGQAAYDAIQPLLATLDDDELMPINIDMGAAAIGAIGAAERAREPTLLARFQSLPASELDPEQIALLVTLGWATLHVVMRTQQARGQSRTMLPPALVESAVELETRMRVCCEYHLGDHPEVASELARLRPGQGYRDLAGDLLGYAEIYRRYREVLSLDVKHYRDTDEPEAVHTAEEIYLLLGEVATAEPQITSIEARRVWTLLVRTYDDVAATGRWLLRREPSRAERLFPSLFTLGRPSRRGSPGEPEPVIEPAPEPPAPELPAPDAATPAAPDAS